MVVKDEDFADLKAKFDTISAELTEMKKAKEDAEKEESAEDSKAKTDTKDKSLQKGVNFLKGHLKDVLPKEKLDTLTFDELVLAAELSDSILPKSKLNPAPPVGKTDATSDKRPSWQIPEVN